MIPAYLALADGTVLRGKSFGADGHAVGEVVFTTGMTGYQEVITDPSYCGQIVTMTAPHIGNTGMNGQDVETPDGPRLAGLVVRDVSTLMSNWRAEESLSDYLRHNSVVALTEIDTRYLTRLLRDRGTQNGCIGTGNPDDLVDRARSAPAIEGLDLVSRVTPQAPYEVSETLGEWSPAVLARPLVSAPGQDRFKVVAVDFGTKQNILRCLVESGCQVTAVPAHTSAADILAQQPDGIFLSNGPGDPAAVEYAVKTIRELLGKKPIFGICLGHQLLARALGATTYKLKFGHRGLNQPVRDLKTNKVEITSQNHGFVVDVDSIGKVARSTHLHLNDGTSEGLEAPEARAFSVQYHPEAAAGPHDAHYLFRRFIDLMRA